MERNNWNKHISNYSINDKNLKNKRNKNLHNQNININPNKLGQFVTNKESQILFDLNDYLTYLCLTILLLTCV